MSRAHWRARTLSFDPTGITMPPVAKALHYSSLIVKVHGLRQFLSHLRPDTHKGRRDPQYGANRSGWPRSNIQSVL